MLWMYFSGCKVIRIILGWSILKKIALNPQRHQFRSVKSAWRPGRRTLLRGCRLALGLPVLESMVEGGLNVIE